MTPSALAASMLQSWDAAKTVFRLSATTAPRTTEFFDLLRVIAAGRAGLAYNDLRTTRHRGRFQRRVRRWEQAGLIHLYHNLTGPRHPINHKPLLYLRAQPKAAQLLRL